MVPVYVKAAPPPFAQVGVTTAAAVPMHMGPIMAQPAHQAPHAHTTAALPAAKARPRPRRTSHTRPRFDRRGTLANAFAVTAGTHGSAIVTPAQLSQIVSPAVLAQLAEAFHLKGHEGRPVTVTAVLRQAARLKWVALEERVTANADGTVNKHTHVTGAQWVVDRAAKKKKSQVAAAVATAATAATAASDASVSESEDESDDHWQDDAAAWDLDEDLDDA
jgi:hypothetical protein